MRYLALTRRITLVPARPAGRELHTALNWHDGGSWPRRMSTSWGTHAEQTQVSLIVGSREIFCKSNASIMVFHQLLLKMQLSKHKESGTAMGLVNCRDCNAGISDSAPTCPHCGAPSPAGSATLEFVRTSFYGGGSAIGLEVLVDQKPFGKVTGKGIVIPVSPGQHHVEVVGPRASTVMSINATRGTMKFEVTTGRMGGKPKVHLAQTTSDPRQPGGNGTTTQRSQLSPQSQRSPVPLRRGATSTSLPSVGRAILFCPNCGFWPRPDELTCDNCRADLPAATIEANKGRYPV
jgi:hypothetical protein